MEEWWDTFTRRHPLAARMIYYPAVTILGAAWIASALMLLWMFASIAYALAAVPP